MASDRVVPCADQKGDMTTSLDCAPHNRQNQGVNAGMTNRWRTAPHGPMRKAMSFTMILPAQPDTDTDGQQL